MKKIVSIILVTFMTLSVSADYGTKFVCSNQDIVISGDLYRNKEVNVSGILKNAYGITYSEESFISIDFKNGYVSYKFLASRYTFIGVSDGFGNYTIQVLGVRDRDKGVGVEFYDVLILAIEHEDNLFVTIPGAKKQKYQIDYRKDLSCETGLFDAVPYGHNTKKPSF